jgi:DNA-binding transcriptional ArsR family regulator
VVSLKAVEVVSDVKIAGLLVDPAKRQILRHLAERELTQKMLGDLLGMTDPSVYYHLKALRVAGLITVARTEPEAHGILQKFYTANALYFLADYPEMPLDLRRYFLAVNLERLRGVFAILRAVRGIEISLSSGDMERLADRLAYALVEVAKGARYQDSRPSEDRESLIINLYGDALQLVIERDPDSVSLLSSKLASLGFSRRPGVEGNTGRTPS